MKNTGLIIALGVMSSIAIAATVALSTKGGRDAAEKATGKVKEVSGKAVAKTKEVSGKAVAKTKEVSGKVISKIKKAPAEATCEEICAEAEAVEAVEVEEELPEIAPEA
ncbi:MAG: hypothetical protein IJW90_02560 [Clostridia bacterium]|nr:hypothetical protein [Clostridia bacterium]